MDHPADDPEGDETVAIIEGVAAGSVGEGELTARIFERARVTSAGLTDDASTTVLMADHDPGS